MNIGKIGDALDRTYYTYILEYAVQHNNNICIWLNCRVSGLVAYRCTQVYERSRI